MAYCIYKIRTNPTIDYAAEELKKYLRMMMPRCGEITVSYDPEAKAGYRLGLLEDFGVDGSEAKDLFLDDILHIDTDEQGGVIAGSNSRSVLQAVYRFLQENGCRWLYPGVDGEYIPVADVKAVSYHKMADVRIRAQCNEGCESQTSVLETIEFSPKIGLNSYMLEFDNPKVYYGYYYDHKYNPARESEPVSNLQVLQWKRQCEVEIAKRGLIFQDMGHGWTAEPFGLDSTEGWLKRPGQEIPDSAKPYLALINGERGIYHDVALNTNFCMSNATARSIVVKAIADYAQNSTHVDFLHVWLADANNNHCECDECRKKMPSDWYVMLMNELDKELTARHLPTRIVFCVYYDTAYAPAFERIQNPDRFTMMLGAITRQYTETPDLTASTAPLPPYNRNKNTFPKSLSDYMGYMKAWEQKCGSPKFCYEYHFWVHQYYDLGGLEIARRIYEDVHAYKKAGFSGIIEDGSQRSFWPNGFAFYVYGQTLFDTSLDFDALQEDYFSHAYGEPWREIADYLAELGRLGCMEYLCYTHRATKSYYRPELAPQLRHIPAVVEEMEGKLKAWQASDYRVQTVSYQLLRYHALYCKGIAPIFAMKAEGKDDEACAAFETFLADFGKYEIYIERYFDQGLLGSAYRKEMFKNLKNPPKSEVG